MHLVCILADTGVIVCYVYNRHHVTAPLSVTCIFFNFGWASRVISGTYWNPIASCITCLSMSVYRPTHTLACTHIHDHASKNSHNTLTQFIYRHGHPHSHAHMHAWTHTLTQTHTRPQLACVGSIVLVECKLESRQ